MPCQSASLLRLQTGYMFALCPAAGSHRGGRAQELAVPVEGAIKPRLERELGSPVEHGAGALGVQELMTNFVARLVQHYRTKRRFETTRFFKYLSIKGC